ncbi:MAG: YdhR family protein [Leptolyngbya sp. SIO1D8]|nr:YdhR family protein [Leptolyngbya sp. SIO1D8]
MFIVFVNFSLSPTQRPQQLAEDFANISGMFYDVPGLLKKYFTIAEDGHSAGGVYLWESRDAAEAFYTENFQLIIEERYGATPQITYFNCPVLVDNQFHYEFQDFAA